MSVVGFVLAGVLVAVAFMAMRLLGRVQPAEARALVDRGAMLVDLQPRASFGAAHIPRARNIPLAELPRRLKELGNKDRPLVVYGVGQSTNAEATRILRAAGFTRVHDLGPMSRWD